MRSQRTTIPIRPRLRSSRTRARPTSPKASETTGKARRTTRTEIAICVAERMTAVPTPLDRLAPLPATNKDSTVFECPGVSACAAPNAMPKGRKPASADQSPVSAKARSMTASSAEISRCTETSHPHRLKRIPKLSESMAQSIPHRVLVTVDGRPVVRP